MEGIVGEIIYTSVDFAGDSFAITVIELKLLLRESVFLIDIVGIAI